MKIRTLIVTKTMKKIILICIFLSIPLICRAEYNPFETVDEARERKAADRYYQRQENPYKQKPLGGYSETLSGSSLSRSSSQKHSSDEDDSSSRRHSSSYESSSSRIPQYHSPLETIDEQRSRHRTESYERKKSNPYGYDEPLGGHSEKLGDTEPYQKKKSSYYGKDKHYYGDEEEDE